jgi:hypothetical protein
MPARFAMEDASNAVAMAACGFLVAGAAFALLAPPLFWLLLAGTAALGLVFLCFRHTVGFCAA